MKTSSLSRWRAAGLAGKQGLGAGVEVEILPWGFSWAWPHLLKADFFSKEGLAH